VRLARPAIAYKDDRFGAFDVTALSQLVDLRGRDLRRLAEVELFQSFQAR
jgi:hypothetical protein